MEESKLATMVNPKVGAPPTAAWTWKSIDWKSAKETVRRLQERIAKATQLGKFNKVKVLQRLLTKSFSAMVLAVKRVTENKGKNTPGVDKVIWKTPQQKKSAVEELTRRGPYKASPLRRIHIPKKNGKLRPLGIPTKKDRAVQAIHLLALDPVAETLADKNSYGFRPKRSIHDAIAACFNALSHKSSAQWILEGDIKACFDKISHEWLEKHVTMDKLVLKAWLKAGYMENNVLHNTVEGCPQGGIASPVLANIALDGLEKEICAVGKRKDKINFVRYADDWVVTASTKEILEEKVLPTVTTFLKERGLELSTEKTKITHINEGFDFLGFNIRKYGTKLLIKPGEKGIKAFLGNVGKIIDNMRGKTTRELILRLNPVIQGWANHNKHVVSKRIYSKVDHDIFQKIWIWARRRHPNKNKTWIKTKYYKKVRNRNWVLFSPHGKKDKNNGDITLKRAADTSIVRHVKIKAEANPYDTKFSEYFKIRYQKHRMMRSRVARKRP
jgi:RNA-directed DNA polymerase